MILYDFAKRNQNPAVMIVELHHARRTCKQQWNFDKAESSHNQGLLCGLSNQTHDESPFFWTLSDYLLVSLKENAKMSLYKGTLMAQKSRPVETAFTRMFNIDYPIVSAPMFLVSNEKMVIATGQAGGLGAFPALNFRPIENYRKAIQSIKKETSKPFAINIIVQKSNTLQEQHIDIALEENVPMIITSLGSPKSIIERAKGTNTKIFCDVIGLTHARKVADLGADGLIAVGSGAGGHAGETSLFALLPYLKKNIPLPLIAAGSIVDGKGMLAAFALGADAIYMGTRMIATHESPASDEYKKAILNAGPDDVVNTDRVDGFDGNFIMSDLLAKMMKPNFIDNVLSQSPKIKRSISLLRAGRMMFGGQNKKVSYKTIFSAGHGTGLIDSLASIEEVLQSTVAEYHSLTASVPR